MLNGRGCAECCQLQVGIGRGVKVQLVCEPSDGGPRQGTQNLGSDVSGNKGRVKVGKRCKSEGDGGIEVSAAAECSGGVYPYEDGNGPCPTDDHPSRIVAFGFVENNIGDHTAAKEHEHGGPDKFSDVGFHWNRLRQMAQGLLGKQVDLIFYPFFSTPLCRGQCTGHNGRCGHGFAGVEIKNAAAARQEVLDGNAHFLAVGLEHRLRQFRLVFGKNRSIKFVLRLQHHVLSGCGLKSKFGLFLQVFQCVLGHLSVRRPLATPNAGQSRFRGFDLVASRQRCGFVDSSLDQGTQPSKHASDVFSTQVESQMTVGVVEDKIHFLRQGTRFFFGLIDRGVRGPNQDLAVPRHSENHPTIAGFGNQNRFVSWQDIGIKGEVDALTRLESVLVPWIVQSAKGVAERTGGVHKGLGSDGHGISMKSILDGSRLNSPFFLLKPSDLGMIQQNGAFFGSSFGQGQRQANIVKFAIQVLKTADDAFAFKAGEKGVHF